MPQALTIIQQEQLPARHNSELSSANLAGPPKSIRNRLPDERCSVTHKFQVGSHEGYLVVGLYPDGQPGEIFITMAKEGSTVSGLVNSFAQAISIGLQHGVSLKTFCDKFSFTRSHQVGPVTPPSPRQHLSLTTYSAIFK